LKSSYNDFRVTVSEKAPGEVSVARGRGAVASAHRQASALAIDVLKDGGNAFDAAFALAFSLCIYHPQAGNIGGGGYLVFHRDGIGTPQAISFREQAPRNATREAFLLPDGMPDPEKTAFGPTSICTPGSVKAFFKLQASHGRLKASDLLLDIARRAEDGAIVTQYEADCLNRLAPKLAVSPEAKKIYTKSTAFLAGDILPNPALARTFEALAKEGESAFYRGAIAELIVKDMAANGGFLTAEDLATYEIRESDAISTEFHGKQVWTVPPEGGGGLLLDILGTLDREEFFRLKPCSPEFHHFLAQAAKIAFIDRMDYLGDVSMEGNATYQGLFDRRESEKRFNAIDPRRDTPTDELIRRLTGSSPVGTKTTGVDTTHFSVIDTEGNAVSCSYTMNLRYGSKWAVEGAGFLLNGSIDSFSFLEGKENYFGVIGSAPNLFAPNKRPASNMAPVLVTDERRSIMAIGTPGGPTIPTTLASVLAAILGHGTRPEDAIRTGRLHHQAWPDTLSRESLTFDQELLAALSNMGYPIKDKHELIADVQGVFRDNGAYLAVGDYRREGQAMAIE
jgi:gamma-glutamyltranspeptidase/glutathione hydrolase